MCRKVTCTRCGRPTWAGCGAHVEQVLRDVPPAKRCQCREEAAPRSDRPPPKPGSRLRTVAIVLALGLAWAYLTRGGDTSGAEAQALVQKGARLVDVRTPAEFAAGHLPGALNVPVDELEQRLGELGPTEQPIILYCRSGSRSSRAARVLESAGFRQVHDLGPMSAW
jgi:phage shock protein E